MEIVLDILYDIVYNMVNIRYERNKIMKMHIILVLLGSAMLTACSGKTNTVYDETYSDKDIMSLEKVVGELEKGFNARYTLDDNIVSDTSKLFIKEDSYISSFNSYKKRCEEKNANAVNLYIDNYIVGVKEAYDEAKAFGLAHGLLFTDGTSTGYAGSIEEITPLEPGEVLDTGNDIVDDGLSETEESLDESAEETSAEITELQDDYSDEMSDEEYLAYLNEQFGAEPDYLTYTVEDIQAEIERYETKEELLLYVYAHLLDEMYGDWGDNEPSEDVVALTFICNYGHDSEELPVITESDWENYTLEEAKQRVVQSFVYAYQKHNDQLLENYEYMNRDEYKQQFIDSRRQARLEKEEREREESKENEATPYEIWCIDNKDIIEMIEGTNFEEPAFSEVIEHDENGYYIPWEKIYALADDEGRLTEYLEFIAYGQTVNIKMPEAPLSYYADKKVRVVDWSVIVKEAGGEYLSLTLSLPDKLKYVTLELGLAEDNKLYYNSDIATYVFD